MFFKPKIYKHKNERIAFSRDCSITGESALYSEFCAKLLGDSIKQSKRQSTLCKSIVFSRKFTKSVKDKICENEEFSACEEAYAISIGTTVRIFSRHDRGFIYALATLKQLLENDELYCGFLYDYPIFTTRGYRVFLPSRAGLKSFFEMVDLVAEYKYNTIILEIGGAMEYKRHPEINARWADFAKETHEYSGRAKEIQRNLYPWHKNAIHTDNAGGDILTQEECKEIARYCRSRGFDIIPECPTMSHCDYLVMAHPEIREREGDDYPDTYCPNHPDTYTYVFDILEEVIEVFNPKIINIGHDELYSVGVCPRCKGTPAPVLYANDIKKIHDFLETKSVRTMMWAEKLLNAFNKGKPIGGAGHGEGYKHVPALYPCRDLLPRDIIMLHWYNVFNYQYDRVYHDRGYETFYGNLRAINVEHWNVRTEWGIKGGFVSNWGSFDEEYMQRNQQYCNLISTAYAFWCKDFESLGREKQIDLTMKEAHRLKKSKIKNPLTLTHTTDYKIDFKYFYDGIFIDDETYMLGSYKISYSDGSFALLPVKYGLNVGRSHYDDYLHEVAFTELSYSTLPVRYKDGWAYKCVYENPEPNKKITGIVYQPCENKEDINVELISFAAEFEVGNVSSGESHSADEEFAWDGE